MNEPDVTCVIPAFNDRTQLPRAVRSALDQQGANVEVIVVDDCSDGPTREFIEQLAQGDERIRPFFLTRNGGQAQARNIGAALARGRFLSFLDQDDEHAPGWYAFALGKLRDDPGLGAASGRARVIDIPARFGIDESDLRVRGLSLVFTNNIVFRTSVFRASGGFPTGPLWRTRAAGEDGAYRFGLACNWQAAQFDGMDALIHRAREGGATVYFLDRSVVVGDRVEMTRLDEIETNGVLQEAMDAYMARYRRIAREIRACALPAAPGS